MLIEFSIGNFRSFYTPMTLSMLAAKLKEGELDKESIFQVEGLSLLRSVAIFGPNASGKSNLIRAMDFMRSFVLNSATKIQSGEQTGIEKFALNTTAIDEPAYFQIIFFLNGIRYRYGFELDEESVQSEWLYRTRKKEALMFIRNRSDFEFAGPLRKEARGIDELTRPNALFLSVLAQFNKKTGIDLLDWFRKKFHSISGLEDKNYLNYTIRKFEKDESFRKKVSNLMRLADVGVKDIVIESTPFKDADMPDEVKNFLVKIAEKKGTEVSKFKLKRPKAIHPLFNGDQEIGETDFQFENESEGTQKFFALLGPIFDTLENGSVLSIDELEARLHPLLTREIVRLFNSSATNPHNAQLIFATHDIELLSRRLLRRDQIWFTEKNRFGETELFSLAEIKRIRNDASYLKNYLLGRYGAIPYIDGLRAYLEQELSDDKNS